MIPFPEREKKEKHKSKSNPRICIKGAKELGWGDDMI